MEESRQPQEMQVSQSHRPDEEGKSEPRNEPGLGAQPHSSYVQEEAL